MKQYANDEYQVIAVNRDNLVVHAGVHRLPRVNRWMAWALEVAWRKYRDEWCKKFPGRYPLLDSERVVGIYIHPVNDFSKERYFEV